MAKFKVTQHRLKFAAVSNRLIAAAQLLIGAVGAGVQPIDLAALTDSIAKLFGRGISDDPVITDSASIDVAKPFSDDGIASDIVAKNISKTFSDSVFASDVLVSGVVIGNLISAIIENTDSGFIISQGYVDNNLYFAEDYVGIKRIF